MIVARMEQAEREDRRDHPLAEVEAAAAPTDRVDIGAGPPVGSGHHADPIGPQRLQPHDAALDAHRFEIGRAREHQVGVEGF